MPGIPSELFELEIAPLLPGVTQSVPGARIIPILRDFLKETQLTHFLNQTVVPLGLRWRVSPALGLPRVSFSVWRRRRERFPNDFDFTEDQIRGFHRGSRAYSIPTAPIYYLVADITNTDSTDTLTVTALDSRNREIPLQFIQLPPTTRQTVRFQHPFIGGIKFEGAGFSVSGLRGITMKSFSELPGWTLIEEVGMPADRTEITGYDPGLQGFPSNLVGPVNAAEMRLKIARQFYIPPATTLPGGINVPNWKIPEPIEAIEELRQGTPPFPAVSLIQRLDEMFKAVDNGVFETQQGFRTPIKMEGGIHQRGGSAATDPATADVPLLATFLLNSYTDSWFALTSGFGTTDFPEFAQSDELLEPDTYFSINYDYMVSAKFIYRFLGVDVPGEHFALSHRSSSPTRAPEGLSASVFAQNRPQKRDDASSVEVALTWPRSSRLQIQGNAIALSEDGLTGVYLNSLRPALNPQKLALFVPAKPGETSDPELILKNRFIDNESPLPFTGVKSNRYGVATNDAFGRWSDWRTVEQTLTPRLPEAPRLNALGLTPDLTRRRTGNTVSHILTVEIVWDWQDRSPKRFELAAVFHRRLYFPDGKTDNGHIPPAAYPAVFQSDNRSTAAAPLVELTFPSDTPPGTPPRFNAVPVSSDPRGVSVELLPQALDAAGKSVEGEMRRYRVTMENVSVSFQPDEEWYFTLFVKAAEWRNPSLLSDSTPPILPDRPPNLTAYVPNPLPAEPPAFVLPEINWTALPDARGISRFHLAFDRIAAATGGYAVFQAHEVKLRDLAGLPVRSDPNMIDRVRELRDDVRPQRGALDAFSRVNAKLIAQPPPGRRVEYELEVPGTLGGIVVAAVAAVTREQEISPLSEWIFIAVPQLAVPGKPTLSLTQRNGDALLTCKFPRAPKPAGVEILRVRREFPARDPNTMGLPLHVSPPSEWEPIDKSDTAVALDSAATRFRFLFSDPAPPSWFPYLYRAVSVGRRDEVNGFRPGRSGASNLVTLENLPQTPPDIVDTAAQQNHPQSIRLQFRSDAPIEVTPRGNFRLEIFGWDELNQAFSSSPVLSVFVSEAIPLPAGGALSAATLYHSEIDQHGRRRFEIVLPVLTEKYLFRVRLTDPLNRTSERLITGELERDDLPNLADLRTRRRTKDLLIFFESSTRFTQPVFGAHVLEIEFLASAISFPPPRPEQLFDIAFHKIREGNLATLPLLSVSTILRGRVPNPGDPSRYGAIVKNFFIFPSSPRPGRITVRLMAPDSSAAVLERNI